MGFGYVGGQATIFAPATAKCLGVLKIEDPEDICNMLFFTAAGDFLMDLLLRTRPSPTIEEINARMKHTVAMFFRQFT